MPTSITTFPVWSCWLIWPGMAFMVVAHWGLIEWDSLLIFSHTWKGASRKEVISLCVSAQWPREKVGRGTASSPIDCLFPFGRIIQPVLVVSTNSDPSESTQVQHRQKDGTSVAVRCPMSVYLYNKYMSGVDQNDQLRGYYGVRLKGRKFYKYIWWFLFDVVVTNSYILAKNHSSLTVKSVKDFRIALARSLIGDFNNRKRRGRPSANPNPPSSRFCPDQFPKRAERKGRCVYCYHHRRHARHETYWYCDLCQKHLCHDGKSGDCYLLYHQSQTATQSLTVLLVVRSPSTW